MQTPFSLLRLTRCDRCAVRQGSWCGHLSNEVQGELANISHIRSLRIGQSIQAESETSQLLGSVVSGALRIQKTLDDGRRPLVGLLLPSDFFGRAFADYSALSIEAASDDTVVCCFDRQQFEKLAQRFPEIEHKLMLNALDELDAARDWMVLLGSRTVTQRLAIFLMMLYRRKGSDPTNAGSLVQMPISAADRAGYLATTRETFTRITQTIKQKGVVQFHGRQHFEVLNVQQLVRMAGQDEDIIGSLAMPDIQNRTVIMTGRV